MLDFIPRDYQVITRDYIIDHPKCNVWLDMGMGKTVSSLTAADILWLAGSRFYPMLVLSPKRVARSVWPSEVEKWAHLQGMKVSPIVGTPAERITALMTKADVYTMNYENIEWLVETLGRKRWPFRWVIADEATHLKGYRIRHGGKRAAALSVVAKSVHRWTNLTGTPLPNGYIDLWGQQWFVDFGERLGYNFGAFHDRWFRTDPYTRQTKLLYEAGGEEIMDRLKDCTISLRAKDWFDVEDPIPMPVYFDLNKKARRHYDEMEDDLFTELGDDISVEAMANSGKSLKCAQIASGAVFHDDQGNWTEIHDGKLRMLKEIIEETNGQPLLVGYYFKPDLVRLKKAFPHGREIKTLQDEADWNAGKISLAFGHPASMGHGLNLQDGGCIIVFFSQTWNLEHYQQFIERLGPVRQIQAGHPRPVLVFYIMARGTIDEVMFARNIGKAETQDAGRAMVNRKKAA